MATGSPAWASLCAQLAPIAAWIVCLAPFPTIRQVQRRKSVGGLPLLPYSSMVVNSAVWIIYGVLKSEQSIIIANTVGLVLGIYYCIIFKRNCKSNTSNLPGKILHHMQGTTFIIALTLLLSVMLNRETAAAIVGKEGVLFCIILFASPLAVLRDVILTKSSKNIPLPFTLASVLNCSLWSITGVVVMKDFNIYFPNLMGLLCGVVQLIMILLYGRKTPSRSSDVELPLIK